MWFLLTPYMTTTMRLITLALLTASTLVLTDCRKSSEPTPAKPSERERLLTTPGWNLKNYSKTVTSPSGVVTTTDILSTFDPCFFDDIHHFNADGSLTVDEKLIKCDVAYPIGLTWEFTSNETELVIGPGQPGVAPTQILTLTATTLTYADTSIDPNGTKVTLTRTYSAK